MKNRLKKLAYLRYLEKEITDTNNENIKENLKDLMRTLIKSQTDTSKEATGDSRYALVKLGELTHFNLAILSPLLEDDEGIELLYKVAYGSPAGLIAILLTAKRRYEKFDVEFPNNPYAWK